jgi:uncharacterized protein YecT (DUF1311 family)
MIASLLLPLLLQAAPALHDCDQSAADMGIQSALNQCAYRDYLSADAELNTQWKITAAAMKARDTEFAAYGGPENDRREGYFEALLEAQRGWLRYRDAHCLLDGYNARCGSLEPLLNSFCKARLTEQRTEELRALIATN